MFFNRTDILNAYHWYFAQWRDQYYRTKRDASKKWGWQIRVILDAIHNGGLWEWVPIGSSTPNAMQIYLNLVRKWEGEEAYIWQISEFLGQEDILERPDLVSLLKELEVTWASTRSQAPLTSQP